MTVQQAKARISQTRFALQAGLELNPPDYMKRFIRNLDGQMLALEQELLGVADCKHPEESSVEVTYKYSYPKFATERHKRCHDCGYTVSLT